MSLRAIKYENNSLEILNQLLLPAQSKYILVKGVEDGWKVINKMQVRGAPAIAIVGCLSLAVEIRNEKYESKKQMRQEIEGKLNYLVSSRPTAVNMKIAAEDLIDLANQLSKEPYIDVDEMKTKYEITRMFQKKVEKTRNKIYGNRILQAKRSMTSIQCLKKFPLRAAIRLSSEGNQLYEILKDIKNKLDCCFEIISNQISKIEQLQIEVHNLKKNLTTAVSTKEIAQKSYADAIKNKKNNNHILVVKRKYVKDSKLVTEDLKQNIDPALSQIGLDLEINARHGGVIVKCSNSEALTAVKDNIKNGIGDRYEIQEPKRLVPRLIITGLADGDKNVESKDLL
ncbi:hypothetical protein JTB14_010609 [Gonioctena quinquepunctata]|nr:hypothetical protein JTB14_010609 [Gonioctena quinquepunctata]